MSHALLVSIERMPGVREWAAQDLHVQHAGQHDVVDVVALAADEPVVLDALAARAEPADLDLVECGHVLTVTLPALRGGPQHGLHDVLVPGAPAEVSRQRPPHLVLAGIRVVVEQGLRREHHPGRAEAALQAVRVLEALLDRVELARGRQALDGRRPRGRRPAPRASCSSSPAGRRTAPCTRRSSWCRIRCGCRSAEALPQEVSEQQTRLDLGRTALAVERERHAPNGDVAPLGRE